MHVSRTEHDTGCHGDGALLILYRAGKMHRPILIEAHHLSNDSYLLLYNIYKVLQDTTCVEHRYIILYSSHYYNMTMLKVLNVPVHTVHMTILFYATLLQVMAMFNSEKSSLPHLGALEEFMSSWSNAGKNL